MKIHETIRVAFSALFAVDLVWVAYLFVQHLAAGEFTSYLGWAYVWILFFGVFPLLIIFIIYDVVLYVRNSAGREVKHAKLSRYLAFAVFIVNAGSTFYNGHLIRSSNQDVISRSSIWPLTTADPQPPPQSRA